MANHEISYTLDMDPSSIWVTATPSAATRQCFLYVQEAGEFAAGARYDTRRSRLESYLLHLTLEGQGLLEYGGLTYDLLPGQLFWIDCQHPQYYRTAPEPGCWRGVWVHCAGPVARAYYEEFRSLRTVPSPVITLDAGAPVAGLLRRVVECAPRTPDAVNDIRLAGLLTQIMTLALRSLVGATRETPVPEAVTLAQSYLFAHHDQRITLDDLARRYAMNKYHFQRLFKLYAGHTPNEYLILIRMGRAKEYLRTTSMTVGEVARRVGVDNVSHFIQLFKKHEGVTPRLYRRQWQEQLPD